MEDSCEFLVVVAGHWLVVGNDEQDSMAISKLQCIASICVYPL